MNADPATAMRPSAFALLYAALSLGVEAGLMVLGDLRVPQDNAILAPIVLSVPPMLAAWFGGYRRGGAFAAVALGLSALTLLLTVAAGRITGVSTGLLEPVVVRAIAGLVVGAIAGRALRGRIASDRIGRTGGGTEDDR